MTASTQPLLPLTPDEWSDLKTGDFHWMGPCAIDALGGHPVPTTLLSWALARRPRWVPRLLEAGAPLEALGSDGLSPVQACLRELRSPGVEPEHARGRALHALLEAGADINRPWPQGRSLLAQPWFVTIEAWVVEALVQHGLDWQPPGLLPEEEPLLRLADSGKTPEEVGRWADWGANPCAVRRNRMGQLQDLVDIAHDRDGFYDVDYPALARTWQARWHAQEAAKVLAITLEASVHAHPSTPRPRL